MDWQVQFAEVFQQPGSDWNEGGFDVVLANPPYVRQELIKEIKPGLKATYGDLYSGTADLYVFFYYRALQLLKQGGMLSFISSNKWFRAGYGAKLRAHIAATCHVHSITDFGDLPVFESATAYPMIFIAAKTVSPDTVTISTRIGSLEPPYPNMLALIQEHGQSLPASAMRGSDWALTDASSVAYLDKMRNAGMPLGQYIQGQIYYGIKTGLNEAFVIDSEKRAELIAADPRSAELIKPLVMGKDIGKWRVDYRDRWLIFTNRGINIDSYPAIKDYLRQWHTQLTPKPRDWSTEETWPGRKPGSYRWYEMQDEVAYYMVFTRPKIVFPDITKEPRFAFDTSGAYLGNTGYVIPLDDKYLLGVLNSSAVKHFYISISAQVRGGYLRFIRQYVEQIPIPQASPADRATIAALVQKCLDAQGKGPGILAWEAEINARVARLYGLTDAETRLLDSGGAHEAPETDEVIAG